MTKGSGQPNEETSRMPRFQVVDGWGKLPPGYHFKEVSSVAVDARDHVYAFCRGDHPVIVFDRDGNFLRAWGERTIQESPYGRDRTR